MSDVADLRVASLLASRLCHDLVGPLGAVGNGLELVAEDRGMAAEALALAQRSAKRAASRLRFFRYAFGAAGAEAGFGLSEARSQAINLLSNGDIALDWPELPGVAPPNGSGRLLLTLILLVMECLPRGGRIRVIAGSDRLALEGSGLQARLSPEMRAAIGGNATTAGLTARTVVAYFASRLASCLGRLEAIDNSDGTVRLQILLKPPRPAM